MSKDFNIEKVLPFLFCSKCGNHFDIENAKILVTGNDTVIVKVTCEGCGKKYALAFMDLTFPMFAQSCGGEDLKDTEAEEEFLPGDDFSQSENDYCFEEKYSTGNMNTGAAETMESIAASHIQAKNLDKITYDDVLEAHDFIQNFEENWRRYLDRRNFNTI